MSKFKFVFAAISILLPSLFIPANVSSAAGRFDDLVVSQVWFQDVSFCDQYIVRNCFNKSDWTQRTAWVFSVKNTNTKKTAQGVRARIKLIDSVGNTAVNANVRVASAIAPGATVWVAPSVDFFKPFDLQNTVVAESSAGGVTSASATITAASFSAQTKMRFPTAIAEFELKDYPNILSQNYSYPKELMTKVAYDATIPNPRKTYNGFATLIFLTDSGTPIMGTRSTVTLKQGGFVLSDYVLMKKQTAALVGEMKISIAPK